MRTSAVLGTCRPPAPASRVAFCNLSTDPHTAPTHPPTHQLLQELADSLDGALEPSYPGMDKAIAATLPGQPPQKKRRREGELPEPTTEALCVTSGNAYFNKMMRILATRCMKPAAYFCTGDLKQGDFHHYGLAAPIYTHFTSPIRRYADVMVHRLLAAAIGVAPLPVRAQNKTAVHDVAGNLNKRHNAAQLAGRASVQLYTQIFFKDRPQEADAVVVRVRANGLVVLVPRFGIEGPVFLGPRGKEGSAKVAEAASRVKYDEKNETLEHLDHPGVVIHCFEEVRVHISVEDLGMRQELKLKLITPFPTC